jgi:hypothetical protein
VVTTDPINLLGIFDGQDDLLDLLQRDKDFYESQDIKMRSKLAYLNRQLDEAQNEALKCKLLLTHKLY